MALLGPVPRSITRALNGDDPRRFALLIIYFFVLPKIMVQLLNQITARGVIVWT